MTEAYVRSALKRYTGLPVRQYLAERAKGALIPADADFSMTADVVVDDPREPVITPIGVLDARGMMLVRVRVPIKVPMGFHSPVDDPEPDEVEAILPEDMLAISDVGMGVESVTPDEVEDDDGEVMQGAHERPSIKLSDIIESMHAQGVDVEVDVEFIDDHTAPDDDDEDDDSPASGAP